MDSPPKLTGETLIVHHIPLVHCQIPDRQCCSMGKRSNPFCHTDLGITRTTSLPEKDLLQKETLVYSSLIQASCLPFGASDEIEVRHPDLKGTGGEQHNSFILNEYIGPENSSHSSFHLQKNRNMNKPPFPLHEQPFHLHGIENITKQWSLASRQGIAEGQEEQNGIADGKTSNQIIMSRPPSDDQLELPMCNYNNGSSSSLFFDCDQGLDSSPDGSFRKQDLLESRTCSSSSLDIQQNRGIFSDQSEIIDNQHMTYNSDSSCNSSDGVLVNFTAIYNKMKSQSKSNLSLGNVSHDSSYCGHPEMGAFYLDLHSSPNEPKNSCEIHNEDSVMTTCSCHQRCSPALDANCNSYHLPCENMPCSSENSDFTACFQSHARLVVATQNYYKLVTCDLSSQSTPSPVESSITSCSEEHTKSTSPGQPTEYYLFQKPEDMKKDNRIEECVEETAMVETTEDLIEGQVYVNVAASNTAGRQRSRSYDRNLDKSPSPRLGSLERMYSCPGKLSDGQSGTSQRSPPRRVTSFAEIARTRKRSGNSPPLKSSGESSLEFSPILENQKENHVFLNLDEDHYHSLPGISSTRVDLTASCGAPFIHRFNKKGSKNVYETDHLENKMSCRTQHSEEATQKLEPINTFHNQMANGASFDGGVKAEGGGAEAKGVIRYSKEQRPTTLPIQPFILHHPLSKQLPRIRPVQNHSASSVSYMYSIPNSQLTTNEHSTCTSSSSAGTASLENIAGQAQKGFEDETQGSSLPINDYGLRRPAPDAIRPSPLGSYSPVRSNPVVLQSGDSSSSILSPERNDVSHPPRSKSCPLSASLLPGRSSPPRSVASPHKGQLGQTSDVGRQGRKSPKETQKKEQGYFQTAQMSSYCPHQNVFLPSTSLTSSSVRRPLDYQRDNRGQGGKSGQINSLASSSIAANHLSPQTLKWREYRRRNPLTHGRVTGFVNNLDPKLSGAGMTRKNAYLEFSGLSGVNHLRSKLYGQSVKQLQSYYNDFFPDYFSLAEKPPAEFCLSPDGNTESVSIDLLQKKGLVKAVNTAVDLIVAHFGTSREPGVKAKLGNSSVSPNVGHLILKYLCPAMRNILQDGLKAYVLDVIVGQRKNLPWTVIEASTQLGPSTKALNNLFCKISQYTELTNHSIRFNAFIFGLLNIRSLEFWFNHLNNHEDIIGVHYLPTGFLALSHSVCQPLFEELLLLLQPLSLLPFDLDLMFEHQVMQMNKEQLKKKEQLRVKQDLLQSVHSTFQLMRTKGDGVSFSSGPETNRESRSEGIAQSEDAKVATARDGIFVDEPDEDVQTMERKSKEKVIAMKKDKQAGWWYQLMQSSQVYIEGSGDGSNFVKWEKRKKQSTAAAPQWQRGGIEKVPLREGVAEGAENGSVCGLEKSNITSVPCRHSREGAAAKEHRGEAQTKGPKKEAKPSWMGSPPESMLHELKPSKANGNMVTREQAAEGKPNQELAAGRPGMWWGRLFGASVNQTRKEEPCLGKSQRSRLPSGWLGLDQSVYDLMVQTMGTGKWRGPPPTVEQTPQQSGVKALCHHIATEKGQLSFKKGDILRVVSKVDADWLLCGLGAECGLVPIMYVTHPEDEDY
eukprot:gi/632949886/ref/XP_007890407.1/ PREDICTED: iporin isoform X2 [Callorhinchus milii]